MWGLFVQLDQIGGFWVRLVFDRAAFVKFEEYRWIYLAKFALGRSKPTLNRQSRRFGRENGWTITKQLVDSVKLPMDLKADPESQRIVVEWRLCSLHNWGPRSNLSRHRLQHEFPDLFGGSRLGQHPHEFDECNF